MIVWTRSELQPSAGRNTEFVPGCCGSIGIGAVASVGVERCVRDAAVERLT